MSIVGSDYPYGLGTAQAYTKAYKERREQNPPIESWWNVLQVAPDAGEDVIKAAFKALAKRHHPDHGGSLTEMKRINVAYKAALVGRHWKLC